MQQNNDDDAWNRMFEELCTFVRQAPNPPNRFVKDETRAQRNEISMVAVAWGWLQRVLRTSKAVLVLETEGYADEAAPLRRAVLEHAVRLDWATGLGGDRLMELLLKSRATTDGRFLAGSKEGFDLDEDVLAWFDRRRQERSDRYSEDGQLAHLGHVFRSAPLQYGVARQGWLWETARSHPSLETAEPYFTISEELKIELFEQPDHDRQAPATKQLCLYIMIAIDSYISIAELRGSQGDRLQELGDRLLTLAGS